MPEADEIAALKARVEGLESVVRILVEMAKAGGDDPMQGHWEIALGMEAFKTGLSKKARAESLDPGLDGRTE